MTYVPNLGVFAIWSTYFSKISDGILLGFVQLVGMEAGIGAFVRERFEHTNVHIAFIPHVDLEQGKPFNISV